MFRQTFLGLVTIAKLYIYQCSMYLNDMSESLSKEIDVAALFYIGFLAIIHNAVVYNGCGVHQSRPNSIFTRPGIITAAFPERSSQGTSFC